MSAKLLWREDFQRGDYSSQALETLTDSEVFSAGLWLDTLFQSCLRPLFLLGFVVLFVLLLSIPFY